MAAVHVIVVGCGRVGSELAMSLENGGPLASPSSTRTGTPSANLPERFAGRAVLGFGFDREHLEQAGIEEAAALAAVTSGDNSNILTARIARETYEIPNVVARIYDPRRAVIYQRLGIPTVATVAWTTDQVLRRLFPEQSVSEWTDATGSVRLIERALPAGVGRPQARPSWRSATGSAWWRCPGRARPGCAAPTCWARRATCSTWPCAPTPSRSWKPPAARRKRGTDEGRDRRGGQRRAPTSPATSRRPATR